MSKARQAVPSTQESRRTRKHLLALGRKINGTWEVRTFLRDAAGTARNTFWERNGSAGGH